MKCLILQPFRTGFQKTNEARNGASRDKCGLVVGSHCEISKRPRGRPLNHLGAGLQQFDEESNGASGTNVKLVEAVLCQKPNSLGCIFLHLLCGAGLQQLHEAGDGAGCSDLHPVPGIPREKVQ